MLTNMRWRLIGLTLLMVPVILITSLYFYNQVNTLLVKDALGGLMNFVDAKQQGVIRFLGQNEKMADELAVLIESSSDNDSVQTYFAGIAERDVFDVEEHPFKDEIKSGARDIGAFEVYNSIDYVKDGKILLSSDSSRVGSSWTEEVDLSVGYSDPWIDGDAPVITFGAEADGGMVYVNTNAKMLTVITNGEIGNLEGDMGAFYLAGVGDTFDYYITDADNQLITDSRVISSGFMSAQGSTEPWDRTINGQGDAACSGGKYTTNAGIGTGCQEAMGFYTGVNGGEMLGASMPFYDSNWTITVEQESSELLAPLASLRNTMIAAIVIALLPILALSFIAATRITKRIGAFIGDLSSRSAGMLGFAETMHGSSQELVQVATSQESMLVDSSSSLEETAAQTQANADNAGQANQLSQEARTAAQEGMGSMNELRTAMEEINSSSQEVAKVLKTIEEIAFQTNLLALNAAVEAARAGEHGKGFAVVAEEVRNLAQRAAKATRDTAALIDDSLAKAKNGSEITETASTGLETITAHTNKVADLLGEISSATQEQSTGINQISASVNSMTDQTQESLESATGVAETADELASAARDITGLIDALGSMVHGSSNENDNPKKGPQNTPHLMFSQKTHGDGSVQTESTERQRVPALTGTGSDRDRMEDF